jgi:DNA-binding CsgD family transcriptional regulator
VPRSADTQLLELIGETQGLLELADLREGLLVALGRVVPSDWVSINEIGSSPDDVYTVVHPALGRRTHEIFAKHAHENPLLARFARTGDTRPYRFSDVVSRRELHALALYQECYAEIGLEHQIAFIIKVSDSSHVAIALSRKTRNFTDTERTLLDHARGYLIQIYRNALTHTALLAAQSEPPTAAMTARLRDNGLTPAESEVLTHVAHGQSNADIGAALGVSERTIGKHLQRSYHKLGVTNRSQAATLAWTISQRPKAASSTHNAPPPELAILSAHPRHHGARAEPRRGNRP